MEFMGLEVEHWIDIGISALIVVLAIPVSYWIVELILRRGVRRVTSATTTIFDDRLVSAASVPARWLIVVMAAEFAAGRLDAIFSAQTEAFLGDMFFIGYLIVAMMFTWRFVVGMFDWYGREIAARTETNVDRHLMPFFRRIVLIVVVLLAFSVLLSHFGVNITGLVTTLGIGSLAIALAAQAALEDTISGFMIIVDRPFRIGDRIEILDLQTWGDVEDVGLRSSRIRTRDNRMVVVPNSVIGRSLIVNHAYPNTEYRIQIHVGVAYGSDLEHVRQTLIGAVRSVPGVLENQPVEALFLEFGDSALIFRVRWWIRSYQETRPMFDKVNTAIYNALNAEGIVIPFPQRDVHHYVSAETGKTLARAGREMQARSGGSGLDD